MLMNFFEFMLAKFVTKVSNLSPSYFVSKIRRKIDLDDSTFFRLSLTIQKYPMMKDNFSAHIIWTIELSALNSPNTEQTGYRTVPTPYFLSTTK